MHNIALVKLRHNNKGETNMNMIVRVKIIT